MTDTPMTDAARISLIRQGLDHLNRNHLGAAETALQAVLAAVPDEADALQLMGLVRRAQRRNAEAEEFYRRSLAARPAQPHVHHNLGNLLAALGRPAEAIVAEREAIRLNPGYFEAYLGLGQAQERSFDFDDAEHSFRAALRIQPNSQIAMQCLAGALNELGRPKDSEAVLRQALAAGSPNPRQTGALTHNLGLALKKQKRYAEALQCFDSAKAMVPDMALVDYNRANTLQHLERADDAAQSYRLAIARNPLDMRAHRDLNQLLYRMGRDEEFLRSYEDTAALYPEIGALPLGRADFLFRTGRFAESLEDFEKATRLEPGSVTARDGYALALMENGRTDEALREHEAALALEPQNIAVRCHLTAALLRAGEAERALAVAEEGIAREPDHQTALAMWALCLRKLGDPREPQINDYENLVQLFELEPPQGWSDMASFNRDLNASLDRLHRDKREFLDQSLRGGTQTYENLFGAGHDLVELLRGRIDEAVGAYIARMAHSESHPLLKHKRDGFRYTDSWSSRLHDCGFHTNHVHPKGWISSAYYVAVPDAVEHDNQGWIKFGEPYIDIGLEYRRALKPKPGTLVLFPSYMWHGTVPFHAKAARTAIAFDAVPK